MPPTDDKDLARPLVRQSGARELTEFVEQFRSQQYETDSRYDAENLAYRRGWNAAIQYVIRSAGSQGVTPALAPDSTPPVVARDTGTSCQGGETVDASPKGVIPSDATRNAGSNPAPDTNPVEAREPALSHDCRIIPWSSRTCERGTKCCVQGHTAAPPLDESTTNSVATSTGLVVDPVERGLRELAEAPMEDLVRHMHELGGTPDYMHIPPENVEMALDAGLDVIIVPGPDATGPFETEET